MHVIKGHFDGEKVIVPEEVRGLPPGDVIIVFENGAHRASETHTWMRAQESSFGKVWNNDEDAVYDSL